MEIFREHSVSLLVNNFLSMCPFSKLTYIISGEHWTLLLTTPRTLSVLLYQVLYKRMGTASHSQSLVLRGLQLPRYLLEGQHSWT